MCPASKERKRHSLQELDYNYWTGEDRTTLDNLVRAFRGIQNLPPTDDNSFCKIAAYHGEPFVEEDPNPSDPDSRFWGGYCNHNNVLFPVWHRAYLLRLEDALRSIPGCENVTIPFWDESFAAMEHISVNIGPDGPKYTSVPQILTEPHYPLDGLSIPNPLYSYRLQIALLDAAGNRDRSTKHIGYETVRYPLSGLVGTEQDRKETETHNAKWVDTEARKDMLNGNVANWLKGNVVLTDPNDDPGRVRIPEYHTLYPDTTSVYARFLRCLKAPNYTVFSNKASAVHWNEAKKAVNPGPGNATRDEDFVTSLEEPHNAIHLAVGGFYQPGSYIASPEWGANGDMGENNTASFDPIFYFHHCFIDYTFWMWQKAHGLTKPGDLTILPKLKDGKAYPGTESTGVAGQPKNTPLTTKTPLLPFKKPDGSDYTIRDTTNIESQLGYSYAIGPWDTVGLDTEANDQSGSLSNAPSIVGIKRITVPGKDRSEIAGSFVIRTYAVIGKDWYEIGRDAILSRWSTDGCANCQNHLKVESLVPIHKTQSDVLGQKAEERGASIEYKVQVEDRGGTVKSEETEWQPMIEDL